MVFTRRDRGKGAFAPRIPGLTQNKGVGYYSNLERVINLPPPDWFGDGYEVVQSASGMPDRYVVSDGTDYRDRNGNVIVEPWWLPYGAKLHVDFGNSRFYWNGSTKALGDLTAIGDGSYTLAWSSVGATWTGNFSILSDVLIDLGTALATETYGGWYINSSNNQTLRYIGSDGSGFVRRWQEISSNPGSIVGYATSARGLDAQNDAVALFNGINRSVFSVPSSAKSRSLWSNGLGFEGTSINGTITAPATLHFGRSPATGVVASAALDLRAFTLWTATFSDTELRRAQNLEFYPPIHLLGDSFLNAGLITLSLKNSTDPTALIGYSQDGIGSTTLAQQAVRFAGWSQFWPSTLVIVDGSLELTGAAAIVEIQTIINLLTHDRWLYVQSNPINPIGDSRRTDWIAYDAAIRAFVGEDHYCPTLDVYLAAGDGSAEDNAKIAAGQWPLSKCGDGTHPSDVDFHAGIIHDRLAALGWAPA